MSILLLLASVASAETVVLPAPVESRTGALPCMTRLASPEADACGLPRKVCVSRVLALVVKNRWDEPVLLHGGMRHDDAVKTRSMLALDYEADGARKTHYEPEVMGPKSGEGRRLLQTVEYRRPAERLACGVTFELDMTADGRLTDRGLVMYGWTVDPEDDEATRLDVPYAP